MLANDLPEIDLLARSDAEDAAIGKTFDGIRSHAPTLEGDHHAVLSLLHHTAQRLVRRESVVHDSLAAGSVEDARAQADETTRRNFGLNMHAAGAFFHLENLSAAGTEKFERSAESRTTDIKRKSLVGFAGHAVDLAFNDFRLANGELEALAAHVLEKHAEVEQAATRHMEFVGRIAWCHAQRNIGFKLAVEALADLAAGDKLAFATTKRTVVDTKDHVQRRLIDLDPLHRNRIVDIAKRVSDIDLAESFDRAEIASGNLAHLSARKTFETIDLEHANLADAAVGAADRNLRAAPENAAVDATDGDASDIVAPSKVGHEHLQWSGFVGDWCGHALDDFLEQLIDALIAGVDTARGPAVTAGRVNHREIKRMVVSAEIDEKVEDLVHHALDARFWTIALVDDHDRLQSKLERFAQDKSRLRHRAFKRVDKQQATVGHAQYALDLSTEIGVAWSVEDVDAVDLSAARTSANRVGHSAILRKNRDAPLALERVGVHDALAAYIKFDDSRLRKHRIDECRLAMVNVSDDCDVTKIRIGHRKTRGKRESVARTRSSTNSFT